MHTGTLDTAHAQRAADRTRSGTDRCPTTTALHRADDGQIARIRLPGGRLTPAAAHAIATVAGPADSIEVTSRGNLQLRGLDSVAAERAVDAIAAAGLTPSPDHDRARTILASPLIGRLAGAGLSDAFVSALDDAICRRSETQAVSGRVLTVVDDGTAHALAGDADLLIRWDAGRGDVKLVVGGVSAGFVAREAAPAVAAELLGRLACVADAHKVWRARELPGRALRDLAGGAGTDAPSARSSVGDIVATPTPDALPLGLIEQANGRVAVRAVLPLGRLDASTLAAVADLAASNATDLRIDHERGLTLVDLPGDTGSRVGATLAELGLITTSAHPGVGLTACAGASCTRTDVEVRAAARLRLEQRRAGDGREHLVGCARRCGAPRTGTTVVADPTDTPASLAARAAATLAVAVAAPPLHPFHGQEAAR